MKREFSINIIILLLVNFIVKPIYIFAVEAGIQNLTGPSEYGKYFVVYDFVFLFLFLNDAGIQNYNSRFIASNRDSVGSYFGKVLGFKLFSGLLFLIFTGVSAYFFNYWALYWPMLLLIIGVFFLNSVFVLLRSSLSALGYYRWDSYISALDKFLLLIGLGYLVWRGYNGGGFDIFWFPLAQFIAAVVACIVAWLLLKKAGLSFSIHFSFKSFKEMIKLTFPYALILLFSAAYNRADAVMLDQLLVNGDYQAGLYAAAYRFIEAGNMVGFLFASLLLPMFANMISEKIDFQPLFEMAYKILFILGMVISFSCIFYADDLYFLLYSKQYQDSSILLSILMVSFVPVSLAHCFGSFLIADGQLKAINIIFLTGLIINIIGNYVLIPQMESIGAAYTTVATQLFLLIGMAVYISVKHKGIKLNKLFFQTVVICSLFGLIFFIIEKLVLFWMLKLVISIFTTGAIAILIKWIDLSLAFRLIKRKK